MEASPGTRRPRLDAGAKVGGKYRLLWRVAVGGMGEIWRARNEATDADVALKVLRRVPDEVMRARFRGEARLGATLAHRSIVRVFDLLEEPDGALVLVMELLRGESLARMLERRRTLSPREAIAVAVPLLSALAHAHEHGIVHRDVTPANIFLAIDPDGHVTPKLVDFGIAKLPKAGSQTLPGSVLGTPRYMSPEQIRSVEDLDGRSDLFSMAAVLYEVMTGASPFDASTPAASLALVLESSVDPDPLIDPRVWVELSRALSKRPYERHAGAKPMAEALCAAVSETESSLAALLERDPPGREDAEPSVGDEAASDQVTSVEGQSLEARRGPFTGSRLAGLAAATCLAIAIGVVGRRASNVADVPRAEVPAHVAEAPAPTPPAFSVVPPPPPNAEPADSTAPAPAPVQGRSARPPKTPVKPARPAAPSPPAPTAIATTPGF
jgi:eukaryotic-like serine/threonine-protein kinase